MRAFVTGHLGRQNSIYFARGKYSSFDVEAVCRYHDTEDEHVLCWTCPTLQEEPVGDGDQLSLGD